MSAAGLLTAGWAGVAFGPCGEAARAIGCETSGALKETVSARIKESLFTLSPLYRLIESNLSQGLSRGKSMSPFDVDENEIDVNPSSFRPVRFWTAPSRIRPR